MSTDLAVVSARPRHRRLVALLFAGVVAIPASAVLAGSGQAAPTLTIAQAQAQISALQTQEDAAVEAFDAGRIASAKAAQLSARATTNVRTQTAKLNTMYAGIQSFAVATYTGGNVDSIDSLLEGGDPSTVIRKAGMLDEIARSHQSQLLSIHAQQITLTAAQTTAAVQASAAAQQVTRLAAAKDHIQTLIDQQNQVLSQLQAQQRAELLAQQQAARAKAVADAQAAVARQAAAARAARAQVVVPAAAVPTAVAASSGSGGTSSGSPSAGAQPTPVHASGNAGQVALQWAETQMGKPYAYGAAGPGSYDCSGLTMRAFQQAGISLPHSAADQYGYGTHVSVSQLQPGDLVFYNEGGTIGHVGIYVGNGQMIDANHTGGWVGIRGLYSGLIGGTRL